MECPRCHAPLEAETWITVDAEERPDLVARILDGSLHTIECPTCGQNGAVPAPLLYHDGRNERVLFAVPPDMDEEQWREVGQTLLWSLIGALPEVQRLPYLGQVQAEQGLDGIAQVITAEHLTGSSEEAPGEKPPIVLAVEAILQAHTPTELQQAMQDHPILASPQAIAILRELAHAAFQQGEEEAGSGFSRAADLILELQALSQPQRAEDAAIAAVPAPPSHEDPLDELAFAVLRTQSGADLAAVVDQHPELLDENSDMLLEQWAQAARVAQKPRIADGVDERRRALQAMRAEYQRQRAVLEAVEAFLEADTAEEIEATIVEYGELLTPAADELLARLGDGAEPESAAVITERRAWLAQVRALLPDQAPEAQAEG
ncbi:MAG: CpXC domain-containing protein [Herpetosiphonaceae bacterium]|nr:CpXC domain-containing protein [Herpetosiphonaceae bacterium]